MTTGVILLGRGSSDAGANGELARMARWIFEENDHELVDLAFTGVTWPRLETVVQRHVKLGMTQICVIPVYLFTGVLIERINGQLARLKQQYPQVAFALGKHFGFEPEIFALLDSDVAGDDQLAEGSAARMRRLQIPRSRRGAEHLHDHSHTAVLGDSPGCSHGHQDGHGHGHGHHHNHDHAHQPHPGCAQKHD
jgi:sirohydrochlorin cobaltochelatase